MHSFTYVSSASRLFDESQLREMLAGWRAANTAADLTGLLLYSGGNIIQVLEGPAAAVDATVRKILDDPRHTGVIPLLQERVSARAFPDWSMGFRSISREEMRDTEGFNPFLQHARGSDLDTSQSSAHHLLKVFRDNMR